MTPATVGTFCVGFAVVLVVYVVALLQAHDDTPTRGQ